MSKFQFKSYSLDEAKNAVVLKYAVDDIYFFEEVISFANARPFSLLNPEEQKAFLRALDNLSIAAGISYYKAFVPDIIELDDNLQLTEDEAQFWRSFYVNGLSEFAYKNKISLEEKVKFPFVKNLQKKPFDLSTSETVLVPVGGGKDSNVTIEILRENGFDVMLFSVRSLKIINDCIKAADLPSLMVDRIISPELIRLNKEGITLNGHVPITGIICFIALATAILNGYSAVVFSNERCADEGNVLGANHQWSKSFEAEKMISEQIKKHIVNIDCFSLLRPYSELFIASKFAELKKYHGVFTSCNKAFFVDKDKRIDHWCADCDKCRFVFLVLAVFMDKQELVNIFGGVNLLDESHQESGYKELLGLSGHKPFECVGEVDECRAALCRLAELPEWSEDYIVKELISQVRQKGEYNYRDWLVPSVGKDIIPGNFKEVKILCKT